MLPTQPVPKNPPPCKHWSSSESIIGPLSFSECMLTRYVHSLRWLVIFTGNIFYIYKLVGWLGCSDINADFLRKMFKYANIIVGLFLLSALSAFASCNLRLCCLVHTYIRSCLLGGMILLTFCNSPMSLVIFFDLKSTLFYINTATFVLN